MRFLHPEHLWWLAVLPALFVVWRVAMGRVARGRKGFADFGKVERISRVTSGFQEKARALLLAGVFAALIVALAQPRLELTGRKPIYRKQDVIFLLDASPSMRARDVHPSRIEVGVGGEDVGPHVDRHGDDRVGAAQALLLAPRRHGVAAAELLGLPGTERLEAVGGGDVGDAVEQLREVPAEVRVPGV